MTQKHQTSTYPCIPASNFLANKPNKENVFIRMFPHFLFFYFVLQFVLDVFVCVCVFFFSMSARPACAFVLQECGRSGTFREVCCEQRFYLFIYLSLLFIYFPYKMPPLH